MLLTFEEFNFSPDPPDIERIYSSGFRGTIADPAYASHYRNRPGVYEYGTIEYGIGEGQLSLPYLCVLDLEPEFGVYESQTTGDCVSHSTRNAGMIDYCVDAAFGETTYEGRYATEPIYGFRGHPGQGAHCGRLANYVSTDGPGGFLTRKDHGVVDLSVYNSRIGHNWGRSGTPSEVNDLAKQNKALNVAQCKSIAEARDAIACGFGLSRCGWYGYDNRRDSYGVSDPKGRWAHAMAVIGCDDTDQTRQRYGGSLWLIQNSWGEWNSGPKRLEQPGGSFWIRERVFREEVEAGGVYAIGDVEGFSRNYLTERAEFIRGMS